MPRRQAAPTPTPQRGRRRDHLHVVPTASPTLLPGIEPIGRGDWLRLGVYAYPGWGKTSFAATSGAVGRTLIIRSSLDLVPSRALRAATNLEQYVADTWEKMLDVEEFLRMSKHPYLWVWWDCASVAADVLLDDIWAGTVAAKPSRAFLVDDKGVSLGRPNLSPSSGLDKGEYGRNMERIQQWVRHMVGANSFHFGITFYPHEGVHPTNDEGGSLLRPYMQGKNMTEKICGYMNMVGFYEVKENADTKWRRLHLAENERFFAKDQYDAFLPKGYVDNPDIRRIMTAVERARGKPLGDGRVPADLTTTTPVRRGRRGAGS